VWSGEGCNLVNKKLQHNKPLILIVGYIEPVYYLIYNFQGNIIH